jgi:hypothetical protein
VIQVRDMTDATSGTCDWGGCDDATTVERLDPDSGEWLGVCARHGARQPRPRTARGSCSACGADRALSATGTVYAHDKDWNRCPGSGKPPREDQQ